MTMVRQYPSQLHHPPLFGSDSSLDPYNSLPASPHDHVFRHGSGYAHRGSVQQPMPQQYAHPLSRHNSYNSQGSSKEYGQERSKPAEHMLRRKTPNGILAAAYDGTSVEQTEKPHATKHILLPVSAESGLTTPTNFSYDLKHELPLRSPLGVVNNEFNHMKQDVYSGWDPTSYFQTGSGQLHENWKGPLSQIDSMLNQMPPQQPAFQPHFYGQQHFCGGMEPSLQSPIGPTVSNDQGPYGPYWHDGVIAKDTAGP